MSGKMQIRVNLDKAKIKSVVRQCTKKGTWSALDHLAAVSKQQVPLDQGPLKNSCYVDVSDDGSSGTVSYDTPYAVRQHEELSYQHQRGRKAKYLEDPANDSGVQHEMRELIARAYREEMG
ncbi:MAG: hypothetical protein IKM73_07650 [Acidaminococcaceae bacterium]|nr:hypothetical protein [Acidaminococcaceae bacterium]